jgi:hypothetical protein
MGWKEMDHLPAKWRPSGICLGWVDGSDLYIEPNAAYLAAQEAAQATGASLPIAKRTLTRRLNESGFLLSKEINRNTYLIRRRFQGAQHDVLHLSFDRFREGFSTPEESLGATAMASVENIEATEWREFLIQGSQNGVGHR